MIPATGLTPREFWRKYAKDAELDADSLPTKWANLDHIPAKKSFDLICELLVVEGVPDPRFVLDLPLWPLLNKKVLSRAEVLRHLDPYMEARFSESYSWAFPNEETTLLLSPPILEDSNGLFHRGDLYGFIGIVGLVRLADIENRFYDYIFHLQNLYRALPVVGKIPWMKDNFGALCSCIERFRFWVPAARYVFQVDWDVIRKQIEDPSFTPIRELRRRDDQTGRFAEIDDPIVPAPAHLDWRKLPR